MFGVSECVGPRENFLGDYVSSFASLKNFMKHHWVSEQGHAPIFADAHQMRIIRMNRINSKTKINFVDQNIVILDFFQYKKVNLGQVRCIQDDIYMSAKIHLTQVFMVGGQLKKTLCMWIMWMRFSPASASTYSRIYTYI